MRLTDILAERLGMDVQEIRRALSTARAVLILVEKAVRDGQLDFPYKPRSISTAINVLATVAVRLLREGWSRS